MNERELVDAMIEIIISKQPLVCKTTQIQYDLYAKYHVYCPRNNRIILHLLRQEAERNPALVESKIGRDVCWRVTEGGVLND